MLTVAVFLLVYLGMFLGRLPGLGLDRTGFALLGAITLLAAGTLDLDQAAAAVDVPTIAILFAFMVISAQLRLGGFFGWMTRWLATLPVGPLGFLAGLIAAVGALSAVFSNDIVCLAVAPVLLQACRQRNLAPVPYLVALACAANVGSAATLIGNPQNILVGEALGMDFADYAVAAAVPTLAGLAITWAVIGVAVVGARSRATERTDKNSVARERAPTTASPLASVPFHESLPPDPPLDPWQSFKGLGVGVVLLVVFLATDWPREVAALAGAGLLLTSRRLHSREVLGLVDWQLLVLFVALFIVNGALQATPVPADVLAWLADRGVAATDPGWLFVITVVLSNLVSNVPAIMLLLPVAGDMTADVAGGTVLALASTLAGNLFIISSIANIIVAESAARLGQPLGWRDHARYGLPIGLLSLALAAAWVL